MVVHQRRRLIFLVVVMFIGAYHLLTMTPCCMENECDFRVVLKTESSINDSDSDSYRPPPKSATKAVASDLILFKNPNISTILQTPNYRWFDDKAISAQNNIYLENYKLHYCKIDKNMGSTMQAIFCFIDDQKRYGKLFFESAWQHGLDGTECGKSTAFGPLRKRFLKAAEDTDFFAEVKCFACRGNLECFIPKLHDFLYKQSMHRPVNKWPLDWHFMPQSWYCDYDRHLDKYDKLFRYGRNDQFWTELVGMLGERGVPPQLLQEIETKLKTKKNIHATFDHSDLYEQQLRDNPQLLEYVYKIYHLDFVWFNYRLNASYNGGL